MKLSFIHDFSRLRELCEDTLLIFLPEADDDFDSLDRRQQVIVDTAIKRVLQNPLPQSEGGYGKPLGHKGGRNLTGFFKIKLKREGIGSSSEQEQQCWS